MKSSWMVSTAFAALIACPTGLYAQSDAPAAKATTDAPPQDSNGGLADIIVTAQRRSENLQRAAVAVTAATGETLTRAGVTDTTQLTAVIPALQIGNVTGPFNAFYLRGVGNFTTNALSDSAVAFGVDGVYYARTSAAAGAFYDLERVEVLKGPQGTLYGRNATGGAINVITAKPQPGEFSGFGTAEYGNYNTLKLAGAVNAPLGDKGAIRIAGQIVDRDGYITDGTSDEKSQALRVQMRAELTDTLKVTIGGDYYHQGGRGGGATLAGFNLEDRIGLSDPRAVARYRATTSPSAGNTLPGEDGSQYQNNTFFGANLQADLETGLGTFTVIPAYRSSELDYRNGSGGFYGNTRERDEQFSVEARLASDDTRTLRYLVGGYYLHETSRVRTQYNQVFSHRTESLNRPPTATRRSDG